MRYVTINEAKTHFFTLVCQAAQGEEIIISKAGVPQARLVPLDKKVTRIKGLLAGKMTLADDFDQPLPDTMLNLFNKK